MAVSKWRSIADDLIKRIESGEIPRGSQLPTEYELQTAYKASRNTVRDAIKWLIQRQLVVTHAGTTHVLDLSPAFDLGAGAVGAVVTQAWWDQLAERGARATMAP